MSAFSIKFPSFEKASHRTPIRRALSAIAFPNAAIFRRSLFPAKRFFQGARRSRGDFILWIRRDQLLIVGKVLDCIAFNTSQVPTGCVEQDILTVSPAAAIRPPAPEVARERCLTDDELASVWQASYALGDSAAVRAPNSGVWRLWFKNCRSELGRASLTRGNVAAL
jgi:hypothetical protein